MKSADENKKYAVERLDAIQTELDGRKKALRESWISLKKSFKDVAIKSTFPTPTTIINNYNMNDTQPTKIVRVVCSYCGVTSPLVLGSCPRCGAPL